MLKIMIDIIFPLKEKWMNVLQVNRTNCTGLKDFKLIYLSLISPCAISSDAQN